MSIEELIIDEQLPERIRRDIKDGLYQEVKNCIMLRSNNGEELFLFHDRKNNLVIHEH